MRSLCVLRIGGLVGAGTVCGRAVRRDHRSACSIADGAVFDQTDRRTERLLLDRGKEAGPTVTVSGAHAPPRLALRREGRCGSISVWAWPRLEGGFWPSLVWQDRMVVDAVDGAVVGVDVAVVSRGTGSLGATGCRLQAIWCAVMFTDSPETATF